MTSNRLQRALGGDIPPSARPATVAVADDLLRLRDDLLDGFAGRRAVVEWHREVVLATVGRPPTAYFEALARAMWPREDGSERTRLACLLAGDARRAAIDDATAAWYRERLAASLLLPAFHRAVQWLRKSAGEYVGGDGDDDAADPTRQEHAAMRPALSELGEWQERALTRLLAGFEDQRAVLDWSAPLEVATQGHLAADFAARCYRERSTARALTGDERRHALARHAVACRHVLPAFAAAARDLADRAGEEPAVDVTPTEAKPI